jgi:DNA-directed RNA polymerase subunit RPC12/RpoP
MRSYQKMLFFPIRLLTKPELNEVLPQIEQGKQGKEILSQEVLPQIIRCFHCGSGSVTLLKRYDINKNEIYVCVNCEKNKQKR